MSARGRQLLAEGERIRMFRKRLKIFVDGNDIADPLQTFDQLSEVLPTNNDEHIVTMLLRNIEESKYKEPTPIQMQAIPCMVEGRDVLAVAPTGSGKTCAFLLPLLASVLKKPKSGGTKKKKRGGRKQREDPGGSGGGSGGSAATAASTSAPTSTPTPTPPTSTSTSITNAGGPRAIVVTPTRELAVQIHREFQQLSKGKKFRAMVLSKANTGGITTSGTSGNQQAQTLSATDFVVSTPMRLVHVITRGKRRPFRSFFFLFFFWFNLFPLLYLISPVWNRPF